MAQTGLLHFRKAPLLMCKLFYGELVVCIMPNFDISSGHRARLVSKSAAINGGVNASQLSLSGDRVEVDTGSQAISATAALTLLACTTAGTITLATGAPAGTIKVITVVSGTANATLSGVSPNIIGITASAIFNAAGETLTLVSNGSNWCLLGSQGVSLS